MRFCPKLRDVTSAMEFSTPVMEATVSGPACDARWMSASPLSRSPAVWVCALYSMCVEHATVGVIYDSMLALEIASPLLCVALSIVRELPPYLSPIYSGNLVSCYLRLLNLQWNYQTLTSRQRGLTVSSRWTIPLLLLLHRHHSNHINYPPLGLISWCESVRRLARWPWWRGKVVPLVLICSFIGLWLGFPISEPCWLVIISLLCQVV